MVTIQQGGMSHLALGRIAFIASFELRALTSAFSGLYCAVTCLFCGTLAPIVLLGIGRVNILAV